VRGFILACEGKEGEMEEGRIESRTRGGGGEILTGVQAALAQVVLLVELIHREVISVMNTLTRLMKPVLTP